MCSLSITQSARAPVEHLSLLACVNQKPCSGEGKVENLNSYLSSTQLPKKDCVCGWGGFTPSRLRMKLYGRTPTVTSACSCPPSHTHTHTFTLFIKGTFHRISCLSFCPSPAAIHFNSALVKGIMVSESRPSRAGRAEVLI